MNRMYAVIAVIATSLACGKSLAQHAHVHGNAELQIAVQGQALTVQLASPLENLIGFEHAPRTDKQKAAAQALGERLARPDALFVPSRDARCTPHASVVNAPVLGMNGVIEGRAEKQPSAQAGKTAHRGHSHGPKKGELGGEGHAELLAQFAFKCEQPAALKGVEVRLFDAFRGLRRIDAQVAGPAGQKAVRLSSSQRMVSW
ncbi:MAG: DUF2796 domain-containing protein [Betaproteobacteria bacterium]|nr:DUF2796 domain-containing protein [Betaproteobacteria bacterium]